MPISLSNNSRFRSLRNLQWPFIVLIAVIVLFYWDILTVKGAWLIGDHAEQHFPWADHLAKCLKHGKLPFWTDLIHSGFPITAEGQIGTFYLPNIILYSLLPVQIGYAWNIILHLILSAFFMFALMRTMNLKREAALFGTLVYMFGSTLGGAYYNMTSLKVLTWM